MNTIYMSDLHYFLADFMLERLQSDGVQRSRSELLKRMLEEWAITHRLWDAAAFETYVKERSKDLDEEAVEWTMRGLRRLLTGQEEEAPRVFELMSPAEMSITTTASIFDL